MFVLSRKQNEAIRIADNVRIVVLEVRDDKVRLGIDAPGDVRIQREESLSKVTQEAAAAAGA